MELEELLCLCVSVLVTSSDEYVLHTLVETLCVVARLKVDTCVFVYLSCLSLSTKYQNLLVWVGECVLREVTNSEVFLCVCVVGCQYNNIISIIGSYVCLAPHKNEVMIQ